MPFYLRRWDRYWICMAWPRSSPQQICFLDQNSSALTIVKWCKRITANNCSRMDRSSTDNVVILLHFSSREFALNSIVVHRRCPGGAILKTQAHFSPLVVGIMSKSFAASLTKNAPLLTCQASVWEFRFQNGIINLSSYYGWFHIRASTGIRCLSDL